MSRISSSYIVLLFSLFLPNAICNSIQTGNFTEGKTRGDREYPSKCIGGFLSFFFPLYFLFVVPLFTWLMALSHRLFSAMEIFYPLFFVQQWRYFNHLVLLTNEDDLPLFCWPWRQVHFVLLTNEDNFTLFCWPMKIISLCFVGQASFRFSPLSLFQTTLAHPPRPPHW